MKKLFALSLALVMTLSLAACGGKKTEAPADTENKTGTETEPSSTSEKNTWNPVVGIPGIFLMQGSVQTEQHPACRRLPARLFSAHDCKCPW